jgi:hypothetical protein
MFQLSLSTILTSPTTPGAGLIPALSGDFSAALAVIAEASGAPTQPEGAPAAARQGDAETGKSLPTAPAGGAADDPALAWLGDGDALALAVACDSVSAPATAIIVTTAPDSTSAKHGDPKKPAIKDRQPHEAGHVESASQSAVFAAVAGFQPVIPAPPADPLPTPAVAIRGSRPIDAARAAPIMPLPPIGARPPAPAASLVVGSAEKTLPGPSLPTLDLTGMTPGSLNGSGKQAAAPITATTPASPTPPAEPGRTRLTNEVLTAAGATTSPKGAAVNGARPAGAAVSPAPPPNAKPIATPVPTALTTDSVAKTAGPSGGAPRANDPSVRSMQASNQPTRPIILSPAPNPPQSGPLTASAAPVAPAPAGANVALSPVTPSVPIASAAPAPQAAAVADTQPPITRLAANDAPKVDAAAAPTPRAPETIVRAAPTPQPAQPAAIVLGVAFGGIMAGVRPLGGDRPSPREQALQALTALAGTGPAAPIAATAQSQHGALDMRRDDWPQAMIDRIEALRDAADATSTRISLAPDALGKVDLSIRHDGSTVHVHFAADAAQTRAILADAQPKLAELAQQRGFRLGQATVDAGASGGGQRQQPQSAAPPPQRPASAFTSMTAEDAADPTRLA